MTFLPHRLEFTVGMVLAIAVSILAITAWAFSPNPPSEAIYQPQHWNAY
jgi:hypothetical protein